MRTTTIVVAVLNPILINQNEFIEYFFLVYTTHILSECFFQRLHRCLSHKILALPFLTLLIQCQVTWRIREIIRRLQTCDPEPTASGRNNLCKLPNVSGKLIA